ncbi:MarR family transcriptional regulator [Scytonema tolypothrichoides VB-61278]|nr:MarR family transcriptional regulator [Scytonema tolypothrichoides VB-61278]
MDPSLTQQSRELAELVASLGDMFRIQEHDQLCCYDVTVSECRTLSFLRREPFHILTMHEIAGMLHVTRSGATRIIDKLVSKGYVTREADAVDGRVSRVTPTPSGLALIERIEHEAAERQQRILEQMTPEMRQIVVIALQALARANKRTPTPEAHES